MLIEARPHRLANHAEELLCDHQRVAVFFGALPRSAHGIPGSPLFHGHTGDPFSHLPNPMSAVVCISIVLRLCRSGAGGYHGKNHWRSATLRRTSVKSSWLRPQNTESSNTLICFGIASYHRLTKPLALSTPSPCCTIVMADTLH